MARERNISMKPFFAALAAISIVGLLLTDVSVSAIADPCDVSASGGDLNAILLSAGPGATICLSGTFSMHQEGKAFTGQTISGPALIRNAGGVRNGFNLKLGGATGAYNVTLIDLEVSGFGERGVVCNVGTVAIRLDLHHNLQNGFGCNLNKVADAGVVIQDSEVYANGQASTVGHTSAGMKFVNTGPDGADPGTSVTILNNLVYNNRGNGIWFDEHSAGDAILGNTVRGHERHGIRYEVGDGPVLIAENQVSGSVLDDIDVTSSSFATVTDNVVAGRIDIAQKVGRSNYHPILDIQVFGNRAAQLKGCALLNVTCHDNVVGGGVPPTLGDIVQVVGAGDIATGGNGDALTSDLILALSPDKVLTFGDNAYPDGTAGQFSSLYGPTWGRFLAITEPSPGNHDWHTPGAAGYEGYFGVQAGEARAFVIGDWLFVSMDSKASISAQTAQLDAILAADDHLCEAIYYHHPRYSSGEHGSNPKTEPWWVVAAANGVDVILNGHDHDYERFAPNRGIRQFVVGTGGTRTRPFRTPIAGSEMRLTGNANWGVIELLLAADGYQWNFLRATGGTGTVADQGSASCHA